MKKMVAGTACLLLAGVTAFSLAACSLFSGSSADGNFPSDVAVAEGEYGSRESWLAAQDTPSTYERRLYEEALADGTFSGSYYEFLASLGLSSEDDTAYINRALCSVVAIEVTYSIGGGRIVSDGSGVVYQLNSETGEAYIVTNYHVVAQATNTGSSSGYAGLSPAYGVTTAWSSIALTLYGGETLSSAEGDRIEYVAGGNVTDPDAKPVYSGIFSGAVYEGTDVAVLRVVSDTLKDSSARAAVAAEHVVGEEAYAVGNAEGEGLSVTRGIVSKLSEQVVIEAANEQSSVSFDAMRTDAAINQGNSGGGLFNERGELLGIVTARRDSTGSTSVDGFGYAISAADVNEALTAFGCQTIGSAEEADSQQRVLLDHTAAAERAANSAVTIVGDESEGSGVIYDLDREQGDAYIVTNYHVIYSGATSTGVSSSLQVYLFEDTAEANPISATFVGGVMEEDIAVLRIEDSAQLAASSALEAVAADSGSLTVGEGVYAVGNAGGYGLSVSQGVVSVPGEYIRVASADDTKTLTLYGIRTDAVINHGNSGGGLFNEMGELIGIVNARSEEDGVVAFGYAIPANRALLIAQNVIDNEANTDGAALASLGGLSVYAADSHALFNEATGKMYPEEKVVVRSVASGSTAAEMGLDVGDTLLLAAIERGGATVRSVALTRDCTLSELMYGVRLGDTLRIRVSRRGEVQEFSHTFSEISDFTQAL